jgi:hypothetical protein
MLRYLLPTYLPGCLSTYLPTYLPTLYYRTAYHGSVVLCLSLSVPYTRETINCCITNGVGSVGKLHLPLMSLYVF